MSLRFWAARTPREKRLVPVVIAAIALIVIQTVTYDWPPKQVAFVMTITNTGTLLVAFLTAWGRDGWR